MDRRLLRGRPVAIGSRVTGQKLVMSDKGGAVIVIGLLILIFVSLGSLPARSRSVF